ncbi:MAG: serine/threonine protein kinase [Deltaproteobacteria bacterium]|nr:serine/threonine protein kinase [Deltaproteobacteria bacterium]
MAQKDRAESLERERRFEEAARAYFEIGALADAARMKMASGNWRDAGELLLAVLGEDAHRLSIVSPLSRKHALSAAICFERAGDSPRAVELFVGLGEIGRAVATLEKAGDAAGALALRARIEAGKRPSLSPPRPTAPPTQNRPAERAKHLEASGKLEEAMEAYSALLLHADAARVARNLGLFDRAAELYLDAGLAFEAAECFDGLGDSARSLDALLRVGRDDHRYRDAAILAIEKSAALFRLDYRLDQFLRLFVLTAPKTPKENAALLSLARLYHRNGFLESAKEVLQKIPATDPSRPDAKDVLAAVEAELSGSTMVYEKIAKEDFAFARTPRPAELPALPSLPPLPGDHTIAEPKRFEPTLTNPKPAGSTHELSAPTLFGSITREPPPALPSSPPPPIMRGTPATPPLQIPLPRASLPPPPIVPAPARAAGPGGFAEGARIADRYILDKKIGQGGMALVFRARDEELGQTIAMKVFVQLIDDNAELLRRFKHELLLSRRLNHPNILRLYDIGQHGGFRYITMELLEGCDLKSLMGKKSVSLVSKIDVLLQACAGFQAVHDAGVIHRDVKPQNIFITTQGELKVMDFGIAKSSIVENQTVAGMVAGTPNYMSPEQINGFSQVTPAADLYSLGVIAYELFTGQLPFRDADMMRVLIKHLKDPPPPPRSIDPALPEAIEKLVLKLLEKRAEDRYPSCRAVAEDLRKIRASLAL